MVTLNCATVSVGLLTLALTTSSEYLTLSEDPMSIPSHVASPSGDVEPRARAPRTKVSVKILAYRG